MTRDVRGVDWLKSPETDVKCHIGDICAGPAALVENFGSKVQPRRRGGYRSLFPREDGLVALSIQRLVRTANIRWQRHVADPLEMFVDVVSGKSKCPLAHLAVVEH